MTVADDVVPAGRRAWLFALAGLVVLFLIVPILIVIPMSFSGSRFLDFPPPVLSLRWYERFFTSADWFGAMMLSLKLGFVSVLVATPLGVAAAYAVHVGAQPVFRRLQAVFLLPLIVPHIIIAIGVYYVFVRAQLLGSFLGLALAHVMLVAPLIFVAALSGLRAFDMSQEMVARTLGCTRLQAFRRVTLPQIKGSVLSGALLAFISSLDETVIALFVSSGSNTTITKVVFTSLRDEIDPTVAAVSALMISGSVIVAALAALARLVDRRARRRG